MQFPECTEENNNPKITIIDKGSNNNKSKVIFKNPNRKKVKIIQVEDCVIPKGTKGGRCDYLIKLDDKSNKQSDLLLVFIELKGHDVAKAISQLIDSINYIKQQCSSITSYQIDCIICCTKCPFHSTRIQNEQKKFRAKYKANLKIRSGEMEYSI
ncbi:hypothetical protein VKI21_15055 [Cyanobacterium aponinum UTEX 3222]|uniref:hypothetical protein n=1 Tax=Cyanobacterium aponinum TaxID=379064 RepID=UPI003091E0B1|nr:hypothetical protein VKI21_15055 [Cyanobacterium aponinum UTEX 3222]